MTKEITVSANGSERAAQEKLQQKLMLFQLMERQLETLSQHKTMIDARLSELDSTEYALKEIKGLKQDNETLVPLGSGLYVHAAIKKAGILAELGANVMKKCDISDASELLSKRRKELERVSKQVDEQIKEISSEMNELGPELQRMASKMQQD